MEIIYAAIAMWLIALARTDFRERRLPNRLTVPAVSAAVASAASDPALIAGMAAATGLYLVVGLAGGVGGGDVKLVCALSGMAGGIGATLTMMVIAQVLTLIVALSSRRRQVAHGPPLAAAAAVVCGPWG